MGFDDVDDYPSDKTLCDSLTDMPATQSNVPYLQINDRTTWLTYSKHLSYNTPHFLIDPAQCRRNATFLQSLLPDIDIHYAIKSNPDAAIVNALDDLVDGYDIASAGEMRHLQKIGINTNRMLYSNPVKVPAHLKEAYQEGVRYFAFDSVDEIAKIAEYAPSSNVYVRLKVSDTTSEFPLSRKFGIPHETAIRYMISARSMGLNAIGVTFHVGSQCISFNAWADAIQSAAKLIEALAAEKINISMLNIGGGIPHCRSTRDIQDIIATANTIRQSLAKYIPKTVRVVMEPGRYISTTAGLIATKVIGRESREDEEWIFLDMGVFQGLMEPLELPGWQYPVFTDGTKIGPLRKFVLTGPTCDAYDTIGLNYMLPSDIQVGDNVYFASVGAYSKVYSSTFNGFDIPKTYYISTKNTTRSRTTA